MSSLALFAAGCTWKKPIGPSILLIAVDNLGFGATACAPDNRSEIPTGFEILCEEAIRFTHAYTTSTLSQPALASILTARYPKEHGVRNNGSLYLSAKVRTAPEAAVEKGFRTSFFGGGPPVWRNSGLNQGFELFDDSVVPSLKALYRPSHESVNSFLNWRDSEASRRSYFSVLHFADAQFIDAPTVNDLGELRPSSYHSQLDEIDESLGSLFRSLRKDRAWDDTYVIVAGLQGHVTEPRLGDTRETNLYSERTRITLFIKPARRQREGPFNWKVDSNITLADVGATVFDLVGAKVPESSLPVVSLRSIFDKPEPDWSEDRMILTESDWASWRGLGGRRVALRKGSFLFLNDGSGRLFNTLTDSLETSPLPKDDLRYAEMRAPFDEFLSAQGYGSWKRLEPALSEKLDVGQEFWRPGQGRADLLVRLSALARKNPQDGQLQGWLALAALRRERWTDLKDVGLKASQPFWSYVASRNLNEKSLAPEEPCLKLFIEKREGAPTLRDCPSQELLELRSWVDESLPGSRRQQAMEKFIRLYTEKEIAEKISEQNYASGLAWDVSINRPEGPRTADLILSLPEHRRFKTQLARRLTETRTRELFTE